MVNFENIKRKILKGITWINYIMNDLIVKGQRRKLVIFSIRKSIIE